MDGLSQNVCYAAIVVVLLIADAVFETYFPLPEAVGKDVAWGIYAVFGILGNMMFKIHTDKKVKEISATFPPAQVSEQLAK